jgi:chromatin segregation and condensation protein Rec8/ScpA/Scc1 (kleisin family)
MEFQQLELQLWGELQSARLAPEAVDFGELLHRVEQAIASVPQSHQLEVAGDAMLHLAKLLALRAEVSIENLENSYRDPMLTNDFFSDVVRQTMAVDLSDLMEPAPPRKHRAKPTFKRDSSVAAAVDKSAVLAMVEQIEADESINRAQSEQQQKHQALDVAHDEDISTWVKAIFDYFANRQQKSLPLLELVQQVKYPAEQGEKDKGLPLVKTWLALLLGGFEMVQHGDFYESRGVWVNF